MHIHTSDKYAHCCFIPPYYLNTQFPHTQAERNTCESSLVYSQFLLLPNSDLNMGTNIGTNTVFLPCQLDLQPASGAMPSGRVAASVPENLSLFLDPPAKAEEGSGGAGGSKKLSKDSILSLYGNSAMPQANMAAHG